MRASIDQRLQAAAPEFVFGGECDAAAFLAIRLGDPFVHLRPEEAVRDGDLGKMIVHDIQSKRRVFRALHRACGDGADTRVALVEKQERRNGLALRLVNRPPIRDVRRTELSRQV